MTWLDSHFRRIPVVEPGKEVRRKKARVRSSYRSPEKMVEFRQGTKAGGIWKGFRKEVW